MRKVLLSVALLFVALCGYAQENTSANIPGPELEFVVQLKVALGESYSVGETPRGGRNVVPITGGTFEGPKMKGTVISGGADYQLSSKGGRTEIEAIYSIKTDDGVYIHVRNNGIISMGTGENGAPSFYFRTTPKFEAPVDSKYAWLNNAVFVCAPAMGGAGGGITLNVWMVK